MLEVEADKGATHRGTPLEGRTATERRHEYQAIRSARRGVREFHQRFVAVSAVRFRCGCDVRQQHIAHPGEARSGREDRGRGDVEVRDDVREYVRPHVVFEQRAA